MYIEVRNQIETDVIGTFKGNMNVYVTWQISDEMLV